MLYFGIIGITGRMGQAVVDLLEESEIVGGISRRSTEKNLKDLVNTSSVIIDFSSPEMSMKAAKVCAEYHTPFVCGTTGFSEEQFQMLRKFSEDTPILYSSNFCIGIYAISKLIAQAEKILSDFNVAIIDRHHNKKKDSPSGTALFLASQLQKEPQIVSLRVGGVPGDHICSFSGENEEVVISHRSFGREAFAAGAIDCACWLFFKTHGFYSLEDYVNAEK